MMPSASPGLRTSRMMPYRGSIPARMLGSFAIASAPVTAITMNHTTMIGPNNRPTRAGPRR